MKGAWVWPDDSKDRSRVIESIKDTNVSAVLAALAKNDDGLSNAQIDKMLGNFSQWHTLWILEQLLSLGLIEYSVSLFGDAGKYKMTELGMTVLRQINNKSTA